MTSAFGSPPPQNWLDQRALAELAQVREARDSQMYPFFREFETGGLRTTVAGRHIVNFSSNDYLGLTNHPKVKAAALGALDRYACGLSSSRLQATTVEHVALERDLARFFGYEQCLTFTTGYQAMLGLIATAADKDTTLVLDSFSHACILDGSFLAAGTPGRAPEVRFFNHNSSRSLERVLKTRSRKNALVLVDGVYSLDGDVANLPEFVQICERYGAVLAVDDAHGSGTLGERGRGLPEAQRVEGRVPILMTAFSKVFGGIGGALLGRSDVIDLVKHNARSFMFSASLPVPVVASVHAVLEILDTQGASLVRELHQKRDYFRGKLVEAGFDLGGSTTHIMPIMCRDNRKTVFMHTALFECGILMVPVIYPAVKEGEQRLRLSVTRGHTQEDLDGALELLKTYGDAFFVLSGEDIGDIEA